MVSTISSHSGPRLLLSFSQGVIEEPVETIITPVTQDGKSNALFGHTTSVSNLVAHYNLVTKYYTSYVYRYLIIKLRLIKFESLFMSMYDID